eukprot:tig00001093_g6897.t1
MSPADGVSAATQKQVTFGDITEKNMEQLKVLNVAVFPVRYNDKFYTDLLANPRFTKLVYYNDILVGAYCCRVEPRSSGGSRLYIMTFGVLAPYRRLGVGALMLDKLLKMAAKDAQIEDVYLHVQTNNSDAINFYKKYGFSIIDEVKNYYKRIEPPDCYVLSKPMDRSPTSDAPAS